MIVFKQKILFTEQECDLILKTYIDKPIDDIENNNTRKYQSKNIDFIKYINEQENFDNAKQVLKKEINEYK